MYLTYVFYTDTYKGTLDEAEFDKLNRTIQAELDYITWGKIEALEEITDEIRFTICEMIDIEKSAEATGGREIASESVGSHSVSYVASGENSVFSNPTVQKLSVIKKWLGRTGLLYRGVIRDDY